METFIIFCGCEARFNRGEVNFLIKGEQSFCLTWPELLNVMSIVEYSVIYRSTFEITHSLWHQHEKRLRIVRKGGEVELTLLLAETETTSISIPEKNYSLFLEQLEELVRLQPE